jgi:hypothetical protein
MATGRPPHQPSETTQRLVELASGCGIIEDDIALILGIAPHTLRKHYADELRRGMATANLKVAKNLFRIATGTGREAVTAAIFWTKVRMGWSEYGPAPRSPLGKKEEAQRQGVEAGRGTDWGDLVDIEDKLPN